MPIDYSTSVPSDPRGPSFPIVRTPPRGALVGIVTSKDLCGTFTHYFHGRTTPHDSDGCEACKGGLPYRWHAYMSVWAPDTGLHFLFECTAQAAEYFVDYRSRMGTLRGCKFQATRHMSKINGRVLLQLRQADLTGIHLPQPPDIPKCLAILWGLPSADVGTRSYEPENKMPRIHHEPKKD